MMPTIIIEDDLPNLLIPKYDGQTFGNITDGPPYFPVDITNKTLKIAKSDASITTTESLHNDETNANFKTGATATVIVVIFFSDSGLHDVEIIEDTTVDAGTGTTILDISATRTNGSQKLYTTKPLTFANDRFITIKINSGGVIATAVAYVIE